MKTFGTTKISSPTSIIPVPAWLQEAAAFEPWTVFHFGGAGRANGRCVSVVRTITLVQNDFDDIRLSSSFWPHLGVPYVKFEGQSRRSQDEACPFLPRDAMLERYMLSSCVCPSFRPSVRLSVCLSTPVTLFFWCQKSRRNSNGVTPYGVSDRGGVGSNSRFSTNISLIECVANTQRDSPVGSMRRGQRTFQPDNKEDRRTCFNAICRFNFTWGKRGGARGHKMTDGLRLFA